MSPLHKRIEKRNLQEFTQRFLGYSPERYTPAYFERRLGRFLNKHGLSNTQQLKDLLINNPDAAHAFKNEFYLSYTTLYREALFFKNLTGLIEHKINQNGVAHIWHAGCAQGHEAYSLAILLEEKGLLSKCKIYATDSNKTALAAAVKGIVRTEEIKLAVRDYIASGGMEHLTDYFNISENNSILKQRIISKIKFAIHELGNSPPFQKFDVIICRNVLIYYDERYRTKLLTELVAALHPDGYIGFSNCEPLDTTKNHLGLIKTAGKANIYQANG